MKKNRTVAKAFEIYKSKISVEKKGVEQERYRIDQICRSFLGEMRVRDVTSIDIAKYRDLRLNTINPRSNKLLSTATVRLELSLLSSFFDICKNEDSKESSW